MQHSDIKIAHISWRYPHFPISQGSKSFGKIFDIFENFWEKLRFGRIYKIETIFEEADPA